MTRIRTAASERLADLALEHEKEISTVREKMRAGLRRAYAMTGMSAVFSAVLVGAAVSAAQPQLIDDAVAGISTALPEPVIELHAWVAPSSVGAEVEAQDELSAPSAPAPRRATPATTFAGKTSQAKKPSSPAPSSVFTCSDDEYDPLNPCLL